MTDLIEKLAKAHYLKMTELAAKFRPGAPFMVWEDIPAEQRNIQLEATRASVSTLEAEGYAVVPREPTLPMIDAGDRAVLAHCMGDEIWDAMLAAAPKVDAST